MSLPPVETKAWPRGLWLAFIIVVMGGQVGFIFWLAARKTEKAPTSPIGASLYLSADQAADLPGVSDPTLFVLPNIHGFSGPAWLQFPPANYSLEPWTEPARPLEFTVAQLGGSLAEYVHTNKLPSFELALKPEPQLGAQGYLPLDEAPSSFTIEGDIASRTLLTPLKLEPWPAADILKPTEVQIAVDTAGRVFSAAVIGKSASPEANANALALVRSARFAPLRWVGEHPPVQGRLTWGKIVFRWQTVARAATSATTK